MSQQLEERLGRRAAGGEVFEDGKMEVFEVFEVFEDGKMEVFEVFEDGNGREGLES